MCEAVIEQTAYQKYFTEDPDRFGRVAVLYGGVSAEREVSLSSGKAVLEGLLAAGVDAFGVDVGANVIAQILALKCDRVFIVLHGAVGEDGKIQSLLALQGIPYTGSQISASALAMDKVKTKRVWQGLHYPTPIFETLSSKTDWEAVTRSLGGECFVKPVSEGSSIGMSIASTAAELKQAYLRAAKYDQHVIAEARIVGREFTVAVLNGQVLPAVELKAKNVFYDYDAKYLSDETQYISPCALGDGELQALNRLALGAYNAVGCESWGRVDFMQDDEGRFYLLEVNTVPGMTEHSLFPMAAKAAGIEFADLLLEILWGTLGEKNEV